NKVRIWTTEPVVTSIQEGIAIAPARVSPVRLVPNQNTILKPNEPAIHSGQATSPRESWTTWISNSLRRRSSPEYKFGRVFSPGSSIRSPRPEPIITRSPPRPSVPSSPPSSPGHHWRFEPTVTVPVPRQPITPQPPTIHSRINTHMPMSPIPEAFTPTSSTPSPTRNWVYHDHSRTGPSAPEGLTMNVAPPLMDVERITAPPDLSNFSRIYEPTAVMPTYQPIPIPRRQTGDSE
ncbi:hypothetical protein H0H93_013903, partial [Arthromyces matolae]